MGAAQYVADLKLPRMLHAQILRPGVCPCPDSIHRHLGSGKKRRVVKVVTGKDYPLFFSAAGFYDQRPLAVDKVRHGGEPVAAVIADTLDHAKKGVAKDQGGG